MIPPTHTQILRSFLKKDCLRQTSSRSIRSSLQRHVEQTCQLSWSLLTTSPPLIISQPLSFKEDWQDREFEYWDKRARSFKLYYTRPVLYRSFEGGVGVKGWVGNCLESVPKTPSQNSLTRKGLRGNKS